MSVSQRSRSRAPPVSLMAPPPSAAVAAPPRRSCCACCAACAAPGRAAVGSAVLGRKRLRPAGEGVEPVAVARDPLARPGVALGDVAGGRRVVRHTGADAGRDLRVAALRLEHLHGEGGHALGSHRGAHVAVVDGEGDDVLLGDAVAAQLPDELAGVAARHLEDGEAAGVGEDGVLHGGGEVGQLGEALGGEHEGGAVLAQLGEHGLVVDAGHGLHLVHDDERPSPLLQGQALLLADDGVDEVEDGRAHEAATSRPALPERWRRRGCRRRGWCGAGRWWSGTGRGWRAPASRRRSRRGASEPARGPRRGTPAASPRSRAPTSPAGRDRPRRRARWRGSARPRAGAGRRGSCTGPRVRPPCWPRAAS